jgi:hypothetical protein
MFHHLSNQTWVACQTSMLNDYINLQKSLKDNNVPFNLLKSVNDPTRWSLKEFPHHSAQSYTGRNTGSGYSGSKPQSRRNKIPLSVRTIQLENIP